jgi:hypothetical protein
MPALPPAMAMAKARQVDCPQSLQLVLGSFLKISNPVNAIFTPLSYSFNKQYLVIKRKKEPPPALQSVDQLLHFNQAGSY